MRPILVLDCGSRSIAELVDAVRAEDAVPIVRSVPIQGTTVPLDARFPVFVLEDLASIEPAGIVISGTPHYLYTANGRIPPAPFLAAVLERCIPLLGVCGGHELLAHLISAHYARGRVPRVVGANPSGTYEPQDVASNPIGFEWYVDRADAREQGMALFGGLGTRFPVWMWHVHQVRILPPHCTSLGGTVATSHGALSFSPPGSTGPLAFGLQFHPETSPVSTRHAIFSNFVSLCAERS